MQGFRILNFSKLAPQLLHTFALFTVAVEPEGCVGDKSCKNGGTCGGTDSKPKCTCDKYHYGDLCEKGNSCDHFIDVYFSMADDFLCRVNPWPESLSIILIRSNHKYFIS